MIKENLQTVLNKKMDRRDFLKFVGLGIVAASSVGSLIKMVAPSALPSQLGGTPSNMAYGAMPYGGKKA